MTKQCIELESEPCTQGKDCHMNCCNLCLCFACEYNECQDREDEEKTFE